jgi:hypothetical protein
MMQDNPFADLIPQQPVQPQAPGIIYGRRKQPTQLELNRDNRADDAADRAAAAADRAARADLRAAANTERAIGNDEERLAREGIDAQAKLRGEFNALPATKRFGDVRASREQIRALVNNPNTTASDDLAMIFSFMRSLDPQSVVREGEFATAQGATGVPQQIINTYNRLLTGERLSPEQRKQFAQTADRLYQGEREQYNQRATQYRELAQRQGIDPDLIARRYVPDQPAPVAPGAKPNPTSGPQRPAGDIQFGDMGGAPVGAEAYQAEVEAGIRNGTLKTADDVAAVAAKYRYAAPDRAETEKMFEALRNGARYGGAQAPVYESVRQQREQMMRERGDSIADPFVRGAADTVSLGLADEIAGIGNAIVTGGSVDENIALERGKDQFDEQRNFLPRLSGQITGGFALPIPAGATTPGRLAAVGAGYGAGYGFGSADGGLADRLAGAAVGGAVGGGLGYAGGSLAQRLAGRGGPAGNPQGRATYQAAQEAGLVDDTGRVLALPADVGGPMTRRFTAGAAQSPFGAGPITRSAERINDAAAGRLGQIAGAEGAPLRQEALGELGQNAAQGYIDRTGAAAQRAYSGARDLAGDAPLQGARAVANIDAQLAELAATSNTDAPLIAGLQRLRADLANGDAPSSLSIDAIRRLRTSTRAEAAAEGLRGTDYNRRAGMVLDELSNDIATQLSPEAAAAFRAADRAYAERLNTIDDVMTQVVGQQGDRSAEAVANRLIGLSRGDSARLRTFLNAVEPEEAGIIRGSLIQEMGRSTSGQQNAAGDAFSLQAFLTNWDKMPARTRDLLFRGEHRQAIEALARYAEGARGARAYANTSNTAGAANATGVARSAASGAAAVGTLGASVVLENLTGRLLGSRRFAQWLSRAPRQESGVSAWARRLGVIATREPALAPDIAPLQAALSQSPGRAAADEKKN